MLTTKEFLDEFRQLHCFQIFGDNAEAKKTIFPRWFYNDFKTAEKTLKELNDRGAGIFFVVNETDGQGRTEKNITKINYVFVDLDGAPISPVLNSRLVPNLVVETSPKRFHCYWKVKNLSLSEFPVIQLALAHKFNGDKTVRDVSRVMRVPGFFNQKNDSFLIRAKHYRDHEITLEQLLSKLELDVATAVVDNGKPCIKLEEAHLVGEGERHETMMKLARKWAAKGLEEIEILDLLTLANRRFDPPIGETRFYDEARRIIRAVKKYEGGVLGSIKIIEDFSEEEPDDSTKVSSPETALTDNFAFQAPGLVGEIQKAITSSAIFPTPILALQAALVTVSMLKRKNYTGYFNGYCNLYTLGTGSAAGGKGHNLSCVDSLLSACGADGYTVGKLVSSPSLSTALNRTGGCALSMVDEAGIYLAPLLNSKFQDKNSLGLREMLMVMFNANRKIRGAEYSSRQGAVERLDVQSPFLSLYGVTTPETFFGNIRAEHASDGFLSRFLVFQSVEAEERERNWNAGQKEMDLYLLTEMQKISNILTAQPIKLKFKKGAEERYKEVINFYDKLTQQKKDTAEVSIRGRQGEHFDKLCIIFSDFDNVVSVEAVEYANKIVMGCADSLCCYLTEKNLFKTKLGELTEQVMRFINQSGIKGRSKTEIAKRLYHIPARERDEIIKTLLDGQLIKLIQQASTGGRVETRYRTLKTDLIK